MGLMNKLKNILFEEEEVEIPVIEKKENQAEVIEKKEPHKEEETKAHYSSFYDDLEETIEEEKKVEEKVLPKKEEKKDVVRNDQSFAFPSFDEEEFEQALPKKRATNVLEYERNKNDRKMDYKYRDIKEEVKVQEKVKFKPSPIISPVYGILDKNYTPEDITNRTNITPVKNLDVDSVRKKAFGIVEEVEEPTIQEEVVFDDFQKDVNVEEENLNKARTIDELLNDSSDEMIDLDQTDEVIIHDEDLDEVKSVFKSKDQFEEKEEEIPNDPLESFEDDDVVPLEEENEEIGFEEEKQEEEPKEEETIENKDEALESDLFDLIDSMYENREDGE